MHYKISDKYDIESLLLFGSVYILNSMMGGLYWSVFE